MSKARRSIYTDSMDDVIKEFYGTHGADYAVEIIRDRYNKTFTAKQIRSRARVLGVAGRNAKMMDHMQVKVRWNGWQQRKDFTGPDPWVHGVYMIIRYQEYRQPDPMYKGKHYYWVRCLKCGTEVSRNQSSILSAVKNRAVGCSVCSTKNSNKKLEEDRKTERARHEQEKREWEEYLKKLRVPPIEYVPRDKRFDNYGGETKLVVYGCYA